MIHILVGTNRPHSRSAEVAKIIHGLYKDLNEDSKIMDLKDLPMSSLEGEHFGSKKPKEIEDAVEELLETDGIVVVCPEYNGSMPGILKHFLDHWKYPDSFEHRPVAFVGLGGLFGGLRPVEHLQQVFGYRNGYIYPDRVFLINIWNILKDGKITDPTTQSLLESQAQGFCRFIKALKSENLHGKDYKKEK